MTDVGAKLLTLEDERFRLWCLAASDRADAQGDDALREYVLAEIALFNPLSNSATEHRRRQPTRPRRPSSPDARN